MTLIDGLRSALEVLLNRSRLADHVHERVSTERSTPTSEEGPIQ